MGCSYCQDKVKGLQPLAVHTMAALLTYKPLLIHLLVSVSSSAVSTYNLWHYVIPKRLQSAIMVLFISIVPYSIQLGNYLEWKRLEKKYLEGAGILLIRWWIPWRDDYHGYCRGRSKDTKSLAAVCTLTPIIAMCKMCNIIFWSISMWKKAFLAKMKSSCHVFKSQNNENKLLTCHNVALRNKQGVFVLRSYFDWNNLGKLIAIFKILEKVLAT